MVSRSFSGRAPTGGLWLAAGWGLSYQLALTANVGQSVGPSSRGRERGGRM